MKKLSAVSLILIFAISLIVCSASGKVTVQKQQSESVVANIK